MAALGGRVIPARCEQRAGRRFVGRKWTLSAPAGPCRPCSNDQQQASSSAYAVSADSAPAYRLYLLLCWLWDRHGTAGGRLIGADPPIRKGQVEGVNVGGHLVNPVALHRYPALSPDHLAQMAYATADLAAEGSSTRRTQRQQAREALDRVADQTGAVVVPAPGAAGTVQVLPAASHKAAHDGKDDLSRNLGST